MAQAVKDISWQAEEYIVRDRNVLWYFGLILVGVGLSALSIWQQWWTFLAVVVLSIIAILTSNLRPPRKINYSLTKEGLTEGDKLHKYEDFKAFGILKEGSHFSAVLIPKKRLALSVKVYFPGNSGEGIVDHLGAHLPMEEVKLDFLDKIVNFLRI
ncbi:MAG: hypothetical protein K6G49_01210 [Candidatus Saccharibacteria bacterium]|nr:hypothetical protein [Candidatus Saccharibacteria bacterium]